METLLLAAIAVELAAMIGLELWEIRRPRQTVQTVTVTPPVTDAKAQRVLMRQIELANRRGLNTLSYHDR